MRRINGRAVVATAVVFALVLCSTVWTTPAYAMLPLGIEDASIKPRSEETVHEVVAVAQRSSLLSNPTDVTTYTRYMTPEQLWTEKLAPLLAEPMPEPICRFSCEPIPESSFFK